jgi:hypothetical protein
MFRATMCPSSGETTVFIRPLVLVILCGWLSDMPAGIPDSHPHRITITKCRRNTVVFSDDGHIVVRDMYSLINILKLNILRINCAPSWLYLQDYTGMHGQQNIRIAFPYFACCCLQIPCYSCRLLSHIVYALSFHILVYVVPFFDCIIYFTFLTYSDRKPSEPQSGYVPWKQIRVIALAWMESSMPLFLHLIP